MSDETTPAPPADETTPAPPADETTPAPAGDRPPRNAGRKRTVPVEGDAPKRRRRPPAAPKLPDIEDDAGETTPATPAGKGKGTTTTAPAATRKRRSSRKSTQLRGKLVELVTAIGTTLMVAGVAKPALGYDAGILIENADRIAGELVKMGERNENVAKALEALVTTSEYGGSLMVLGAVLLPILANHGILPREVASLVGAPLPPERSTVDAGGTSTT